MKHLTIAVALMGINMLVAGPVIAQSAPDTGQAMFEKADANHDGVITLDEWKTAGRRERGFKMVDADHDGKITPDELRAAAAKYGR